MFQERVASDYGPGARVYEPGDATVQLADGGVRARTGQRGVGHLERSDAGGGRASPDAVKEVLEQVEGGGPDEPPVISEGSTYGEMYGVLSVEQLAQMLPPDQAELAQRLAEVAETVELHMDASSDVAMVAQVSGPDAAKVTDLGKSLGAALSLARLKAQADGKKDLAQLLDFAKVRAGRRRVQAGAGGAARRHQGAARVLPRRAAGRRRAPGHGGAAMKRSEMVALVDMDGTLCDYEGAMARDLEKIRNPQEPPLKMRESHSDPWLRERVELIRRQPGWWASLERLKLGFDVLEELRALEFELHILTKGPVQATNSWAEKLQWCQRHVPDARVTVTMDKGLVYGKVLVDDWPEYITRWLTWRPRGW